MKTSGTVGLAVLLLAVSTDSFAQRISWVQSNYHAPVVREMHPDSTRARLQGLPFSFVSHGLGYDAPTNRLLLGSAFPGNARFLIAGPVWGAQAIVQIPGSPQFVQGITVDSAEGKAYFCTSELHHGSTVQRANLDGTGTEMLITSPAWGPNFRGLALDAAGGRMYWSDYDGGTIRRAHTDGSNPEDVLTGLAGPLGLAVDPIAGELFWCDAKDHAIGRSRLDGASPTTILTNLGSPQYVAVDPVAHRLYWTELGAGGQGKIRSANTDGTNPRTVLGDAPEDSVWFPSGIVFTGTSGLTAIAPPAAPISFALEQNYPNPFNPSTTIRFSIPRQVHVTLRVYDVVGREVATLVDAVLASGAHDVRFDAARLASGMYLCRMEAEAFVQTRTLMLIR